jgi:hypothetical protein
VNEESTMHDDVYQKLPSDLVAALRDPRTVLPDESAVYERVSNWTVTPTLASPMEVAGGAWIEVKSGQSLTGAGGSRAAG